MTGDLTIPSPQMNSKVALDKKQALEEGVGGGEEGPSPSPNLTHPTSQ